MTRPHTVLRKMATKAAEYARRFGIARACKDWEAHAAEIIARRDRLLNDPKLQAKRQAAAAARDRAAQRKAERLEAERLDILLRNQTAVNDWRAGLISTSALPYGARTTEARSAMLRIIYGGEPLEVETSQGATAPLTDAVRLMKFWQMVRRDGRAWVRDRDYHPEDGDFYSAGSFDLRSILEDGSAMVGCHYFSRGELLHFAGLLTAGGFLS